MPAANRRAAVTGGTRQSVAFLMGGMTTYRVPFFERLRDQLADRDVSLSVVYSPTPPERQAYAIADLPWGHVIPDRRWRVRDRELVWQPFLDHARSADVVVVLQQSRMLLNYLLLARQRFGGPKVAFWGHGQDMQSSARSTVGELVKRRVSRWPHWWFAYNHLSAQIVEGVGFPPERITDVQNSVDTRSLRRAREQLDEDALADLRRTLGLGGGPVGIFCGTMYPLRQIPYLLEAALAIRARVPDFELIAIGAGEQARFVQEAAEVHSWIHYVGRQLDDAKVPYFALADVVLFSGPVGLAIVDSFALGLPIAARRSVDHNPEIAYAEDGVNSLLVDDGRDPIRYGAAVAELLTDDARLERLKRGAACAGDRYTIEAMAERFAAGLEAALKTPRRRRR